MPNDDSYPTPPPLPAEGPKWQFSLRAMMLGMTGLAVLCGFAMVLPYAVHQAILGLLWIGAAGWLLTGVVFALGDQRAFCIGAATVVSSMWTNIGGRFMQGMSGTIDLLLLGNVRLPEAFSNWLEHGLLALVAIANGYFCIRARRYFERHSAE